MKEIFHPSLYDKSFNVHLTELCYQDTVPLELEKANTSKKQGPAVKAHSNIRKMISAFEGSLNQVYQACFLNLSICYCNLAYD